MTEQIEDGRRFVDLLADDDFTVWAAGWVKPSDEERWYLYVATPEWETKGPLGAARESNRILRLVDSQWVTVPDVRLVGSRDPISADLRELAHRYAGRAPTRTRRPMLGGLPVDEVYVYPPPVVTLKGFPQLKARFPSAELVTIPITGAMRLSTPESAARFTRLAALMGHVNASEFDGKPPETLLYMGPKLSGRTPHGMLVFVYRPEGWNAVFREDTETWERVVYAESGSPLYEPVDFGPLAAERIPDQITTG